MNDKQQLLIDCISLLPVIGILVLITVANDQLVTMVAAYVLCVWYWLWLESSHVVMEIVEKAVE